MRVLLQNVWTPAKGEAIEIALPAGGGVYPLPKPVVSNQAVLVTNTGGQPAWFSLQTDEVARGQGGTPIAAGQSLLFAPSGPADYHNPAACEATFIAAHSHATGGLLIARGSVATQIVLEKEGARP